MYVNFFNLTCVDNSIKSASIKDIQAFETSPKTGEKAPCLRLFTIFRALFTLNKLIVNKIALA